MKPVIQNAVELLRWFFHLCAAGKARVVLREEKAAVGPDPSAPVFRPTWSVVLPLCINRRTATSGLESV